MRKRQGNFTRFMKKFFTGLVFLFFTGLFPVMGQDGNLIIQRILLSVSGPDLLYNETLLAFIENATEGFDNEYDAPKIHATNLSLYTFIPGLDLAIQGRPLLTYDHTIQLGINSNESGLRTLQLNELDNVPASSFVVLEDVFTQALINLRTEPTYTFNLNHLTDTFRFKLHVGAFLDFQLIQESCRLNDGAIELSNPSAYVWSAEIKNPFGQLVWDSDSLLGLSPVGDLFGGIYAFNGVNAFGDSLQIFLEIDAGLPFEMQADVDNLNVLPGAEVFFSASGPAPDSLIWLLDASEMISQEAEFAYLFENPGTFLVRFMAWKNDCEFSKDFIITVANDVITKDFYSTHQTSHLYPNPAHNYLNTSLKEGTELLILGSKGQRMGRFTVENAQINLEKLPAGLYTLQPLNDVKEVKSFIKK